MFENWIETIDHATKFELDKRFQRKLLSLCIFKLSESIRVVKYNDKETTLYYNRFVSVPDKYMLKSPFDYIGSNFTYQVYKILSFIFNKSIKVENIESDEFVFKYDFVRDIFPVLKRNSKLDELLDKK